MASDWFGTETRFPGGPALAWQQCWCVWSLPHCWSPKLVWQACPKSPPAFHCCIHSTWCRNWHFNMSCLEHACYFHRHFWWLFMCLPCSPSKSKKCAIFYNLHENSENVGFGAISVKMVVPCESLHRKKNSTWNQTIFGRIRLRWLDPSFFSFCSSNFNNPSNCVMYVSDCRPSKSSTAALWWIIRTNKHNIKENSNHEGFVE